MLLFGHKDTSESVIPKLRLYIENIITEYGVTNFYVGNQGGFDTLVVLILKEMKNKYPEISYSIVLAYLPKGESKYNEKNTLYPNGIESVPKRFCISWRNNWMINRSQYVICYVNHITGGAAKFVNIAKKKELIIFNC